VSCCGQATLFGRRVWIVELNGSELRRAKNYGDACAARVIRRNLRPDEDDQEQGRNVLRHELGAQGEIVVAKVLGVHAPLDLNAFSHRPAVPPCWSVRTQLSSSRDMLDGYLRAMRSTLHPGWRYVLVERDVAVWGGYVFIVHGWIADERLREVSVQRYSYSSNRFVHRRHLEPLTRELYDTTHGAPTDEPPAPAPYDTDADARQLSMDEEAP
jgi:hypothetical protein